MINRTLIASPRRQDAREALQALRLNPSRLAPQLALTMMFEPVKNQFFNACITELVIVLETALRAPSESLLAAIRVQWWCDTVTALSETPKTATEVLTVPLAARLGRLVKLYPACHQNIIDMIGHWQNACHEPGRNSSAGWQAAWRLMAQHSTGSQQTKMAGDIGLCFYFFSTQEQAVAAQPPKRGVPKPDQSDLAKLRRRRAETGMSWLYLNAALSLYLTQIESANQSPTMIWQILKWQYIRPPRQL
jgi:hypothetical protein